MSRANTSSTQQVVRPTPYVWVVSAQEGKERPTTVVSLPALPMRCDQPARSNNSSTSRERRGCVCGLLSCLVVCCFVAIAAETPNFPETTSFRSRTRTRTKPTKHLLFVAVVHLGGAVCSKVLRPCCEASAAAAARRRRRPAIPPIPARPLIYTSILLGPRGHSVCVCALMVAMKRKRSGQEYDEDEKLRHQV